jgi:hypothetical protein
MAHEVTHETQGKDHSELMKLGIEDFRVTMNHWTV